MSQLRGWATIGLLMVLAAAMWISGCGPMDIAPERSTAPVLASADWIWAPEVGPNPKNRFTYFRKVVDLPVIPESAMLHMAADSNARLWINGQIVKRKVSRYHEKLITTDRINAAPYLHTGKNVILVLHHNWGEIVTFQRTGNIHAGLYLNSSWIKTDGSWKCLQAPEFVEHETQICGVIGHFRIRYPVVLDGRKVLEGDLGDPGFDDSGWQNARVVTDGPWPAKPQDSETPSQREYRVPPMCVVAAGTAERRLPVTDVPGDVAAGLRMSVCNPDPTLTENAGALIIGRSLTITGRAGQTKYITVDFQRPVHGYPWLEIAEATEGLMIDFGYGELSYALYSGEKHVDRTGWINTEGVVGPHYADRYITRSGQQCMEFPDERTARWMTLHIHFPVAGRLTINSAGIVKSQYPIEPVGSFQCGDERIDQIVKLCLIHAEVTMSDAYVDTPGREDGQWIEDARPRAIVSSRWFDDTLLRDFMARTLAEGQGPDGHLHPFAPANFPAYPATFDWSVQWVAIVYDAYVWSGDQQIIRAYWGNLCRYWDTALAPRDKSLWSDPSRYNEKGPFYLDEQGLWRTGHIFADMRVGQRVRGPNQASGIVTPMMIERLLWSVEMAESIGEKEQARKWRVMAERMIDAFRKYHIVRDRPGLPPHVADRYDTHDPNIERGYSQAGQTFALMLGLMPTADAIANLNYAFPAPDGAPPFGVTHWNSPSWSYRVLRVLTDYGFSERAVAHLIERFTPYLPSNPRNPVDPGLQGSYGGPLPEYWISREDLNLGVGQHNPAQPDDPTGSHGWQAVPLLWLHDSLLGVRIVEPGGGKLRIAPDNGGLPYVAGHTNTPKGLVWVYWDPQQWRLEVAIPAGLTAELVLPHQMAGKRIKVTQAAGIPHRLNENRFNLNKAGSYVFQAQ